MTLYGPDGRPLPPSEETPREEMLTCQHCGSTNLFYQHGFGGHWSVVCNKCGTTVMSSEAAVEH